jgi:hemolysin activation/secretion protein
MRVHCLAWCAVLALTCAVAPAVAQAPPPTPPLGSPLPGIEPLETPRLAPSLPRPSLPAAPEEAPAPGPVHAIRTVAVIGVTAFPDARIGGLTGGLIGDAVPESRIEAVRRALVDLYRNQGYVYTTVNAIIDAGALRLQVVEGYVADVKLEGDVGPAATQVLRFLDRLIGQKPLSTAALERWLLLAQDIPGLTVRSVLNPSLTDPGGLILIAQVSRRPISGFVSADNRAFDLTGPAEGLAAINFDSFTEFGERTQLSLFAAFGGTNIFGQASEELFLGGSGLKLRLYGGTGIATPSGALALIGYNGDTRVFGGQLSYPLVRARDQSLNLIAAFDAVESDISNSLGAGGTRVPASYDSLRVLRIGVDYALLDLLFGPERSGVTGASARFSQGLPILGAAPTGDASTPPPRLGEVIDFRKIAGELTRTQMLFQPFRDTSVALKTSLGWQYSSDLLPPAEKFYLGGPRFNRGYYYGQVSGDKAVTLSAELQFNTPVPLPAALPVELRSQFYAFYDWGKAFQNTQLESNVVLQSAGGGVRLFVDESTEIDFEGVYRINRYPNGQGPGVSALNAAAFYWQVLFRF